jgi:hypothetical protein
MLQPKARVYMSGGEEAKDEELLEQIPLVEVHRLCTLYSEAHPVILMQSIQEYLMDKDITPIISNEDWTVTYQVPMKLASSEED